MQDNVEYIHIVLLFLVAIILYAHLRQLNNFYIDIQVFKNVL